MRKKKCREVVASMALLNPNALRFDSWASVDSVQFLDSVHSVTPVRSDV